MNEKKVARVKVLEAGGNRPIIEVEVARGTKLADCQRAIDRLDVLIEKLTGCPCMSGLDIRFRDRIIDDVAKAGLDREIEVDIH